MGEVKTRKSPPPRIPSRWSTRHNLGMGVLLALGFFFFLAQFPDFSVTGEMFKHSLLGFVITIPCFVCALLAHHQRLQRRHQISLSIDGRQDDVLNGILIVTGALFFTLTGCSFPLNDIQDHQRPPTGVVLQRVDYPSKKTKYLTLYFKPSANQPIIYVNKESVMSKPFQPTSGDTVFISIEPGRLGLNQISHLSWQSKEMSEPLQIYPGALR